jgi:NAD+ synthase (glutamine-hydrolysing)
MQTLRIAMAQINPTVGDLKGNRDLIIDAIDKARTAQADVVVFPELAITGYPPEDLVLKPQFVRDNLRVLKEITKATKGITAIVGFVDANEHLYDAAAVLSNGSLLHVYHKMRLPNYGVFDEYRYFTPGTRMPIVTLAGVRIGINICEDIWHADGPARTQARAGAEVIVALNASPYHKGKGRERQQMLAQRAKDNIVHVVYVNAVGGQDELVFDGQSMILDAKGKLIASGKQFEEEIVVHDLHLPASTQIRTQKRSTALDQTTQAMLDTIIISEKSAQKKRALPRSLKTKPYGLHEEVYRALVLGTRDYVKKTGFKSAVIGLSGGIDSSLVAAVAVEALGKEHVHGVFMPSQFSSDESCDDAVALAKNLDIDLFTIPIHQAFNAYLNTLRSMFAHTKQDVTEENLQARIRGNILMALSNKFNWLVLTTGNKSEMSTGYATLYGDMAGGFAVIKDVPKTLVYDVCKCINRIERRTIIPKNVLKKAPTAELRPNQKDSDSLPEYPVLDPILKAYVEDDLEFDKMLKLRFDRKTVERVIRLVDSSEYKRRQAPPGVKITPRGLGKDRRFPITNRYRSY